MPEGPETARFRDGLREVVLRKQARFVRSIEFGGRYAVNRPDNHDALQGAIDRNMVIQSIDVKGKFMWMTLTSLDTPRPWYLFITHGMTGGWTTAEAKHPVIKITFDDGEHVTFNDPRRFGTVNIVSPYGDTAPEQLLEKRLKMLGADILHSDVTTLDIAIRKMRRKKALNVCKALMDQSFVSGIGNYIKCEALWQARISPHRTIENMTYAELEDVIWAARDVAQLSYNEGGATLATYSDIDGESGQAQCFFNVYGLKTDTDGNEIVREETPDGRTTHWSPARQR